MFGFKKEQEKEINEGGLEKLFESCQIEQSVRSAINRDEIRGDIPFV